MASQPSHRRDERGTLSLVVRLVTALALALLSLPALNIGAFADDATTDPTADTSTASEPVAEEPPAEPVAEEAPLAEEPVAEEAPPAEEPAAEEAAPDNPVVEEPVVEEADPAPAPADEPAPAPLAPAKKTSSTLSAPAAVTPLVVAASFTGGDLLAADYIVQDENGANDEPGQKDLTQFFGFTAPVANSVKIGWSWDEINWSGNNTGDACALFDTDGDGKANYAVCVTVTGSPATQLDTADNPSPRLYSCNDTRVDRCAGPTLISSGSTSAVDCEVAQTDTDPFTAGDEYPTDTSALCTIPLSNFTGGGTPRLINVCSFPSQEPNSDPSDCVIIPRDALLTVQKVVTPSSAADSTLFGFTITGMTNPVNFSLLAGGSEAIPVRSGVALNLSETVPANWSLQGATCSNGQAPSALNLASEATVTCTFTNTPTATVQVAKKWNINGTLYDNGSQPSVIGGTAGLTLGGVSKTFGTTYSGYLAGDTVSINETASVSNTLCTLTAGRITNANGAVVSEANGGLAYSATLQGGANTYVLTNFVTCRSTLQLNKVVDNGPALASAWTLSATPSGGAVSFASGSSGVNHDVTPGGTYTLGENAADVLYVQNGDWTCDNGVTVSSNQINAPLGKAVTCTVHNATAELTLIKHVVNDNGGSATASDFTVTASPQAGSGLPLVSKTGSETGASAWVRPDATYTLGESSVAGYSQTSLQCKSGVNGTYANATTVNLDPGEHVFCKFVNDDLPAGLTLYKVWEDENTGSGIDADDFTLTATPQSIAGQGTVSGDGDYTNGGGVHNEPVFAGSYLLSESGPDTSWYTASTWACTGATLSGSTVTITNGATVVCWITNTATVPTLTLEKEVLGNDASGGTADDTDFTLTATRVEGVLPTLSGVEGDASITDADVMVGTYTLDETSGPSGYAEGTWDCGADHPVNGQNQITIALGDDVTCEIDNTAIAPKLTLLKKVENGSTGGTAVDTDWTLTGTGPVTVSGHEGDSAITDKAVKAGSYTLSESGPAGYDGSTWNCGTGRTSVTSVTLALGENVTCEVTNTAKQPHLRLVKSVVNQYTTPASATNWMLSAGGPAYIQGAGGTASLPVPIGDYDLDEQLNAGGPAGYTEGTWSCVGGDQEGSAVSIALGDTVVCTIVNTAQKPAWEILKTSDPVDGATVQPGDVITYTVRATKTGGVDPENITLQDNLSDVLDNATFVTGSITAAVGSASLTGTTLTWNIPLLQGTKTLTYQVRVNEGAYDVHLRNHVTGNGSDNCPPTPAVEDADCTTDHPTPDWELTKVSNPATGATVEPGEPVTYTLTATNTSDGVVDNAEVTDNLADVLDNATLTQPLAAGLALSGTTLTWDVPTLQPQGKTGASATVSYTVTVNADQWDQHLRNVATPHNQGGDCATVGGCQTDHPTPAWSLTKVSDPASGTEVEPGDTITYTLTALNTSDAAVEGGLAEDDLSEVLNNATLDTTSLDAGLSLSGTTLTWTIPALQPGASASVSYTVTVDTDAYNVIIENVVVPVGAGGACVVAADCTTTHDTPEVLGEEVIRPRPPVVKGVSLPGTGAPEHSGLIGLLGTLTVGLGALMILADRRRRQA